MVTVIGILQKVLVNHFYKANAGFFLFCFFVLFGLPISPAAFHLSIITGIIQSQLFIVCVMLTWLLYNVKCADYVLKQLRHPTQSFLFCLTNWPAKKTYLCMLYVQAFVYLPVLVYAAAIVWFAINKHKYLYAFEVVSFNVFVVTVTAFVYQIALQKNKSFNLKTGFPAVSIHFPKPFLLMPLFFIWHERKQMLFVTKAFSLLLLFGFIHLYEPERYDIRPLQLCLLLTAAAHSAIVFQIRAFEEAYLTFSRNLPLKIVGRFLRIAIMYFFLLLPEFIFLFKGYPLHFAMSDYPQLVLMVVALLCMFHVALLLEDTGMEQLIQIVFGILAACFFILLYNPGTLFPCAILLLTFVLFNAYFYDFEKKPG